LVEEGEGLALRVGGIKPPTVKYERYYPVYEAEDLSVFEFVSTGRAGMVRKRIVFAKTDVRGIYNLAFGNIRTDSSLDDEIISDNGDRNRILATVAQAIDIYTQRYPRRWIYFKGNSPGRTRLYRMAIGLNLRELSMNYEIMADVDGESDFVPFQRNMKVEGFLIRRRIILQQHAL
jgi:uncharacterized protein DUF6934